jgi:hypothetical protein
MNTLHSDTGKLWKIMLFAIVGIFIIGTVASLIIAKRKVSKVVDTEYYSHGLHYAETHSKTGNAGAGWTITASVVEGHLQVLIHDVSGGPVTGGLLVFDPDRDITGRTSGSLQLSESSPGIYRIPTPLDVKNELHGVMRFTKGDGTVISKVVVIN